MKMIELAALENGAHRNQSFDGVLPDGWALIPHEMEPLEHFPYGEVEAEEIEGVMTLTGWIPGSKPESLPKPEQEPGFAEDAAAMLIDHEYRLTLLELGLAE